MKNNRRRLSFLGQTIIGITLTTLPAWAASSQDSAKAAAAGSAEVPLGFEVGSLVQVEDDRVWGKFFLPRDFKFVEIIRGGKYQGEVVKVVDNSEKFHAVRIVPLKNPGRGANSGDELTTYLRKVEHEESILQQLGGRKGISALEGSYFSPDRVYKYLITPYCEFYLDGLMNKAFDEEHIRYFARQILVSLAHLHERGFSHGCLSPARVGLSNDGITTLVDFGLESAHLGVGDYTMNFALEEYNAPEQLIMPQADSDHRSDIWSLGLILARLVLGRGFFQPEHRDAYHFLRLIVTTIGTAEAGVVRGHYTDSRAKSFLGHAIEEVEKDKSPAQSIPDLLAAKKISPQGIAFITRLLSFDPGKRPTAKEALADPWF